MIHALKDALRQAQADGHDMEHDSLHALAYVDRYTCKLCGCAVLGNVDSAYGDARLVSCSKRSVP